jgi:hypothetical protein
MLNDRGIPNPTEYKRLKGVNYKTPKHKSGTHWKYYAISDMLVNEMYIGHMVQGKYGSESYLTGKNRPLPKEQWIRKENTHTPIIDFDLWNRVQWQVQSRAKPFADGQTGLFARKARCMNCGYTMRSSKNRGVYYLKCSTRHTAKDACIGSFISVNVLEQTVIDELRAILDMNLDVDEVSRRVSIANDNSERLAKLESDKSAIDIKSAEYYKAIQDSHLDKSRGIISESQFLDFLRNYTEQLERMKAIAKDLADKIIIIKSRHDTEPDKRKLIESYTNIKRLDRIMVEKLIDHIAVGKRDKLSRQLPIEIYWNF